MAAQKHTEPNTWILDIIRYIAIISIKQVKRSILLYIVQSKLFLRPPILILVIRIRFFIEMVLDMSNCCGLYLIDSLELLLTMTITTNLLW